MRLLLSFAFLLVFSTLNGQTSVVNFTRNQYGAGAQNWKFEQDATGNLFVANNEGLLTFNGTKWKLYPMPNETIVRSIAFGKDGRLYAGGQDEIGYFEPDASGKLAYHSLVGLLDVNDRQFADVWNIVPLGDHIFFRTSSRMFRLHGNKITAYRTTTKWDFAGIHNGQLVAHDLGRGLMVFKNNDWEELIRDEQLPKQLNITSLVLYQNESLVTTIQNGLFKLSASGLTPFRITGAGNVNDQHFTSAEVLDNGELLLSTYENGLFYVSSSGTLKKIFSKTDGLNSNNVKSIFRDKQKNIWLGLEDGISYLQLSSPIKWINPREFNGASGYAATISDNKIYFALANGIYQMPLLKTNLQEAAANTVQKIAGGLSWNISNVNGRLYAGRDDGFFEIKGNTLVPVDQSTGYWIFKSLTANNQSTVFAAGNYLGVSFFSFQNGTYTKETDLSYLNTSARFLEYDSAAKAIWISHPYRGVYRISVPGNTVKLFTQKEGLPSSLNNHVFKIKNRILIATLKGIYVHNSKTDRFELSPAHDKLFKGLSLRYLQEDAAGNLWFVHEKTPGVVNKASNSIIFFPELQRRIVSGFEHISSIDEQHVLIGGEQGFFLLNLENYLNAKTTPLVFIRNVTSKFRSDSLLYDGFETKNSVEKIKLNNKWNSFHFEFSSPFSSNSGNLHYSWKLTGFEKEWSEWSTKTEKDYTNLPAGDYLFEVKLRNNLNEESSVATYAFTILPPWYKTIWAKILYVLLAGFLFYLIYKQQEKAIHKKQELKMQEQRRLHEEKQQMLAYQHQIELEKSEKEMIQLKNDKLESELASTAMNLVQKKEFILRIKDEISKLNKSGKEQVDSSELKKILKSLTAEDKLDDEWDQFSIHFNKVHGDFLTNLKNKYPGLKPHELKLCAYLRMNLTSKEIAQLMSISVRGVEISRYRLRKKLNIATEVNLFDFLLTV